ncbi:hypothetical protein BDU57DRAFT_509510 [Ampelomyces quisqualis]|uniref:Uncharacterized protein n=1 Tax=Ampelomyces quisqualis TaxID=50730 RepID=A0A6A5R1G9_AMPQU|nr:hypothetical protein BDU57DRAFT_509510 [Ampelomyces quisqualis]
MSRSVPQGLTCLPTRFHDMVATFAGLFGWVLNPPEQEILWRISDKQEINLSNSAIVTVLCFTGG